MPRNRCKHPGIPVTAGTGMPGCLPESGKIPAEDTVRGPMARGFEGGARNFQSANAAYTPIREPHTRPIAALTLPSLRPWRVTPQYAIAYVHK